MDYLKEYQKWLDSGVLTAEEHAELEAIKDDPKEIEGRFYGPLEFGTAGLRGTMAMGLHHMNIYVVRHATQGFANVICAEGEKAKERGVAIAMDCRLHGMEFARAAAEVCAAAGIKVRIFDALRPTPELSFAVRHYGCQAGINVTASHNPKEYNGYKVYWEDGAQLPPQHAAAIARELEKIDIFTGVKTMPYDEAVKAGLITVIGEETDEAFLKEVMAMTVDANAIPAVADSFKLVYTPFHGCGHKLVPEALKRAGVKHLLCEPQQMVIDGNFPTVKSPNPENPEGFYLAIDLAKANDVDFILGTDPDSDRVGIMVRDKDGEYKVMTGNQTFIAEKKNALEESGEGKVVFSYEESYGYMLGDFVRDKDAVTASLLLMEMAAYYYAKGMTVLDAYQALCEKHGFYGEKTHNLVMPGLDGLADMAKLMKGLREAPPAEIAGVKVLQFKDYADGSVVECATGAKSTMELSGSNVLRFELEDGTSVIVRPSGTEPKIKVYVLTRGADPTGRDANIRKYGEWVDTLKK
ncbi:MAG: phospho-sugar mutase [Oscillospiraceae bacterium]|nr:phospho-sugar mutase [Oscillospiraceae bacterium]